MNIKHKYIGVLAILLLTANCYLVSPTPTSSRVPTIESTITPTPTKMSLPLQTATDTQVTTHPITQTCVTASGNNSDLISRGTVVLDDLTVDLDFSVFLFDLESSSITKLSPPGELIVVWGISPDHKYMLYGYDKVMGNEWDFRLIVADSFGRLVKEFDNKFPNDPRFASYYNWQDSENIRVVLDLNDPKVLGISPRIYNVITGDYRVLKTDFPAYVSKKLDWGLDWFAMSTLLLQNANIVYDPLLTRVVYPKTGETVSLVDVETNEELSSILLPNWGRLPKWSTNGEYLAIIGATKPDSSKPSEEIFIVHRDGGEFRRMTFFSDTFEQSAIADYSWSPDGTKIAFLSYTGEDDPKAEGRQSNLMILDTITGKITNLCFEAISAVTHLNDVVLYAKLEPIWSPDGDQIMVSQWANPQSETDRNFNILIIDLPRGTSAKIGENKQPVGWMVK